MQMKYLVWVSPLQDHLVLIDQEVRQWEQVITSAEKVDKPVSSADLIFKNVLASMCLPGFTL